LQVIQLAAQVAPEGKVYGFFTLHKLGKVNKRNRHLQVCAPWF
jgi:hypothetical protein